MDVDTISEKLEWIQKSWNELIFDSFLQTPKIDSEAEKERIRTISKVNSCADAILELLRAQHAVMWPEKQNLERLSRIKHRLLAGKASPADIDAMTHIGVFYSERETAIVGLECSSARQEGDGFTWLVNGWELKDKKTEYRLVGYLWDQESYKRDNDFLELNEDVLFLMTETGNAKAAECGMGFAGILRNIKLDVS